MLENIDPTSDVEDDEATSINKKIEKLDKSDPYYNIKRGNLIEQLTIVEKQMSKFQRILRKQQNDARVTIKMLKAYATKEPLNDELKELLGKITEDKQFITRAIAETIAIRGSNKDEFLRLKSSQAFNQPISATVITNIELKPLPSSEIDRKKEKIKETSTKPKRKRRRPLSLAQKILALRSPMPKVRKSMTSIAKTTAKEYY